MFNVQMFVCDTTACAYYRTILPHLHLRKSLLEVGVNLEIRELNKLDPHSGHDAYVFSRIPDPSDYAHAIVHLSKKSKIIWDLDDDLAGIPDESPVKKLFPYKLIRWLSDYVAASDVVTVSTAYLGEKISEQFGKPPEEIHVLPNLIDENKYIYFHNGKFRQHEDANPPIRVMLSGSGSHVIDLPQVTPTIWKCVSRRDTLMMFWGFLPEEMKSMDPSRVMEIRWGNVKYYPSLLTTLAPHIALMPLVDHDFNRSKSNIKYLEMTMAGAVCVASDIGPYHDTIEDGVDGVLTNDPHRMASIVDGLIVRPDARKSLFKSAAMKVLNEYSWNSDNSNRRRWFDFFAGLPDRLAR